MFDAGSVIGKIKADITEFKAGIGEVKKIAGGAFEGLKGGVDKMNAGIKDITPTLQKTSVGIAAIGTVAAVAIKGWMDEAMEAEKLSAQLAQTIESTGKSAQFSAEGIKEMAGELSAGTNITDDAVTSAATMLLKYDTISKDTMPRVLASVMDVATGMNGGLTPSTEQLSATADLLGKAMQDPESGMKKLKAAGVILTDQQEELIKKMVQTGDTAGAQELLLNQLAGKYEGQAAAQAGTLSGRMEQVTKNISDFKETLGMALLPIMTVVAEKIAALTAWFNTLSPATTQWIAIGTLVVAVLAAIVAPLLIFVTMIPAMIAGLTAIGAGLAFLMSPITLVVAAIAALYLAWKFNLFGIQDTVQQVVDFVKLAIMGFKIIWEATWNAIKFVVVAIWEGITLGFQTWVDGFKLMFELYVLVIKTAWELLWNGIKIFVEAIWNGIKLTWQGFWNGIKAIFDVAAGVISGIWGGLWNGLTGAATAAWDAAKNVVKDGINWIIDKINAFLRSINSVAGAVGKVIGVKNFSVGSIPRLATGGIVTRPTLAMVGEGGEPEAVIPLSKLGNMGGGTHFHFHDSIISSADAAREIMDEAMRSMRPRLGV